MFSNFIIQFIGVLAWIFLIVSYWRGKVNKILIFHVISCLLFALHYYLLGAISGLYVVLFEAIRDFIYYKSDKDREIFYFSLPIYFLMGLLNFNGVYSIFPMCASLIDGYFLSGNKRGVIVGGIVSYIVWFFYDLNSNSYAGAFFSLALVISNIFVVIKNIRNKNASEIFPEK